MWEFPLQDTTVLFKTKFSFYVSTQKFILVIKSRVYLPSGLFNPSVSYKMWKPLVSSFYPERPFRLFFKFFSLSGNMLSMGVPGGNKPPEAFFPPHHY